MLTRRRPTAIAASIRLPLLARRAILALVLPLAGAAACSGGDTYITGPGNGGGTPSGALGAPTSLSYQLLPSGDPDAPDGVLLRWAEPNDDRVNAYAIYSRGSTGAAWSRRATTTSATFHDSGIPHLQYYVAAEDEDGDESASSNVVTIDERNRLAAPLSLGSISLDRAVQLQWAANARNANPTQFDTYRVYSSTYDLDTGVCSDANWVLEGSTVSEDFLVTGLTNGSPLCFSVSSVSRDGHESAWSAPRHDTPRYDARNVIVSANESTPGSSGFRFHDFGTGALGQVLAGDRTDIDFRVERRADGSLWLAPRRAGVLLALYSTSPVTDLTSIDVAPVRSAFAASAIEAVPGYAYVFELPRTIFPNYGAVRITHVARDYLILDWSYQSDPGNPELNRVTSR
jgi:hypothetical protein